MYKRRWMIDGLATAVLAVFLLPAAARADGVAAQKPEGKHEAETRTRWLAVFMADSKIGHVRERRTVADGRVATEARIRLSIGRGDVTIPVEMRERDVETAAGEPISFMRIVNLSGMGRRTTGEIRDGTLHVTIEAAGQTQHKTLPWPQGALLSEGQRLAARVQPLKKGTTFRMPAFDADKLAARSEVATVGQREKVDLLGRVVELTRIDIAVGGPAGKLEAVLYVDDDREEQMVTSSVMGMTLRMVACSREVALSENQPIDFFDRLIVAAPRPLEGVRTAAAITYTLAPTEKGGKLEIPATDNQTVQPGPHGTVRVTVRPAEPPAGATRPCEGDDEAARAALKPSPYIESQDERIVALARGAVGDTKDAAAAARKLEAFARDYISKKTLQVGYASAAEVARSKAGDCSEHAVFLAALCRAAGIPAQVANGVAYGRQFAGREHVFVPHAWVRARVGGRWIGLDAALGRYDAGHILLGSGDGDADSFFAICKTLGAFRITDVRVRR